MVSQTPPRIESFKSRGMVACDGLKDRQEGKREKHLFASEKEAQAAADWLYEKHGFNDEPYQCGKQSCLNGEGWHLRTIGPKGPSLPQLVIPDPPDWLPVEKPKRRGRSRRNPFRRRG